MVARTSLPKEESARTRWVQLGLGLIAMMAISSPQYVWTLFLKPFQTTTGAGLTAIQFTFSLLIVLQTFFSPAQGWLIERFGPRALITTGAALSGLGWILSAWIDSLWGLYATYGLFCGIGTGIVYVGIVGLMVRWFPRARGFATGVVAAGYGFGAILTTFPIDAMIRSEGYRTTLVTFGALLGLVGMAASLFLRIPKPDEAAVTGEATGLAGRARLRASRDVAHAAVLAALRDDDHDVDRRLDGDFAILRLRQGLRRRRRRSSSGPPRFRLPYDRSHHQWADAPVLRLGLGPYRPRKHDGSCLPFGGRGHLLFFSLTARTRPPSWCSRGSSSSVGEKFSPCSPPPSPTASARKTPPPITASFTWRRGSARSLVDRWRRGSGGDRKLDTGVLADHRLGCADRASRALRLEADALDHGEREARLDRSPG